ncbi:MAG: ABC transporter substrate binding protein [Bradyrhizobium sp.]
MLREYVLGAVAGGSTSYGPNYIDEYRLAASHVDRILKGEKPADLPVQASTKYELVVNLKTTKAIGLIVPTVIACERRRHDRIGRTTMHESGIGRYCCKSLFGVTNENS